MWTHWFINDTKTFTAAGNMRSAGYQKVLSWLANAWDNFKSELIKKSFHCCGIASTDDLHLPLHSLVHGHRLFQEYVDEDIVLDPLTDVCFYFL
jgi:hypothetical protein